MKAFITHLCRLVILLVRLPYGSSDSSATDKATALLEESVKESRTPGIQYAVVDSSGIVYAYAGGFADIEGRIPMTLDSRLLAYSMTKTLTAAAVLQLADRGMLHLDDPANMYLDINPYGTSVTVRHLLAHTSGIPNPNPLRWVHPADAKWDSTDEECAMREVLLAHGELVRRPGEAYAYSNIDYWLLGRIIERASGMSYRDYMKQNIFRPLGISSEDIGFDVPRGRLRAKGYLARWSLMTLVVGFLIDRDLIGGYEEGGWLHIRPHSVNGPAFGGIEGNVRGFARFLQDQLRDASMILSPAMRRQFLEPQKTDAGQPIPMTLGWHVGEVSARRYLFKEGGGGGFHCEMRVYPEYRLATIGMTNETSRRIKDLMDSLDGLFIAIQSKSSIKP